MRINHQGKKRIVPKKYLVLGELTIISALKKTKKVMLQKNEREMLKVMYLLYHIAEWKKTIHPSVQDLIKGQFFQGAVLVINREETSTPTLKWGKYMIRVPWEIFNMAGPYYCKYRRNN